MIIWLCDVGMVTNGHLRRELQYCSFYSVVLGSI